MKAFLLAAGMGTRLSPLTDSSPKCLLPINGVPLLEIWLEHLERHGIDQVLVNTHWLHAQVEDFLHARHSARLTVSSSYEPELLGSAGTLLTHKNWVADEKAFLILYADNLTNVDLDRLVRFHDSHDLPFTLGVFRTADPHHCGIVETDANGVVTAFVEKPRAPRSNLAAAGIYVADSRLFDFFPNKESRSSLPLDLGLHVLPQLAGSMRVYCIEEFLLDIGTPQRYRQAQRLWRQQTLLSSAPFSTTGRRR